MILTIMSDLQSLKSIRAGMIIRTKRLNVIAQKLKTLKVFISPLKTVYKSKFRTLAGSRTPRLKDNALAIWDQLPKDFIFLDTISLLENTQCLILIRWRLHLEDIRIIHLVQMRIETIKQSLNQSSYPGLKQKILNRLKWVLDQFL